MKGYRTHSRKTHSSRAVYFFSASNPGHYGSFLFDPNGTNLPGIYPCFGYKTIADSLDAKHISWRYYQPAEDPKSPENGFDFSAFEAVKQIRNGSDWSKDIISPVTQILTDIRNGSLAQVTWIVPAFPYSDHPGTGATAEGPDWVADIVNTIGASQYWNSTAIFITWTITADGTVTWRRLRWIRWDSDSGCRSS